MSCVSFFAPRILLGALGKGVSKSKFRVVRAFRGQKSRFCKSHALRPRSAR